MNASRLPLTDSYARHNRIVAGWLLNYPDRLKDKSGEFINHAAWLELIADIVDSLDPKLRTFLQLRWKYRQCSGRRGWINQVSLEYAWKVAELEKCDPEDVYRGSRNTFAAWWAKIIHYTAREAIRRGLL